MELLVVAAAARGVVVVDVDGGSRLGCSVGILRARSVFHPFLGEKPLTQASASDVLELWEDHGVHIVCPLHCTRALVQRGEGSAFFRVGLVAWGHGGLLPGDRLRELIDSTSWRIR